MKSQVSESQISSALNALRKKVSALDLEWIINNAEEFLEDMPKHIPHWVRALWQRGKLLYWMLVDYWNGDYKFPWKVVAAAVAALLYFINPADLVPDVLPIVGWSDDAILLVLAFQLIEREIDDYFVDMDLDPQEFDELYEV